MTTESGATFFTTVAASPTVAFAPTRSCSRTDAFGEIHAFSQTRTPPQIIAVAMTNAPAPIRQLCAMCTRLSILTSFSMTVLSSVPPVDRGVRSNLDSVANSD